MKASIRFYQYHVRLMAILIMLATGGTLVVSSFIPERDLKQVLRKGKRMRLRRIDGTDIEEDEEEL